MADDIFEQLAKSYLGVKSTDTNVTDLLDRMRGATAGQESGGDYKVRPNARTQATGAYQVLPDNIPAWTQKHLKRRLTPAQFQNDPAAQDAVFNGEMGEYLKLARQKAPDDDTAIRMAAAAWYGGKGAMHRYDDPTKFRPNEPSFREYTMSVLKRAGKGTSDPFEAMAKQYLAQPKTDPFDTVADDYLNNRPSPTNPVNTIPQSSVPQTTPESPETLEAQIVSAFAQNSPKSGVLLPKGNPANEWLLNQSEAKRMTRVNLPEGILLVNHKKLNIAPKDVQSFVKKNGMAGILGYVKDVGNHTSDGVAVTATMDGKEVASAVVTNEDEARRQKEINDAAFPGSVSTVATTDEIAQKRIETLGGHEGDQPTAPPMTVAGELISDPRQAEKTRISQAEQEKTQAALQARFAELRKTNPSLTVDQFNKILSDEHKVKVEKSKQEWLAKNPALAKFAKEKNLDPFAQETVNEYNASRKKYSATKSTAKTQFDEASFNQANKFLREQGQPELSREEFIARQEGNSKVGISLDPNTFTVDGTKITDYEIEAPAQGGGTIRFPREVGKGRDANGTVAVYRSEKGMSEEDAYRAALLNAGSRYGITPEQVNAQIDKLKSAGKKLFQSGKHIAGNMIAVTWDDLANAGVDVNRERRMEQSQNTLVPAVDVGGPQLVTAPGGTRYAVANKDTELPTLGEFVDQILGDRDQQNNLTEQRKKELEYRVGETQEESEAAEFRANVLKSALANNFSLGESEVITGFGLTAASYLSWLGAGGADLTDKIDPFGVLSGSIVTNALFGRSRGDFLGKFGNKVQKLNELSTPDNSVYKIYREVGNVAGALPAYAAVGVAVGGNPVLTFAITDALVAKGKGGSLRDTIGAGAKGAVMGAMIGNLSRFGTMAADGLLGESLLKVVPKVKWEKSIDPSVRRAISRIWQADAIVQDGGSETIAAKKLIERELAKSGLTLEQVLAAKPGGVTGAEATAAANEAAKKLTANTADGITTEIDRVAGREIARGIIEYGVPIGLATGIGYGVSAIEGGSTQDNLKNALLFGAMQALGSIFHKKKGEKLTPDEVNKADGTVVRVPDEKGKPHDLILLKENNELTVTDVTGKVPPEAIQGAVLPKPPTPAPTDGETLISSTEIDAKDKADATNVKMDFEAPVETKVAQTDTSIKDNDQIKAQERELLKAELNNEKLIPDTIAAIKKEIQSLRDENGEIADIKTFRQLNDLLSNLESLVTVDPFGRPLKEIKRVPKSARTIVNKQREYRRGENDKDLSNTIDKILEVAGRSTEAPKTKENIEVSSQPATKPVTDEVVETATEEVVEPPKKDKFSNKPLEEVKAEVAKVSEKVKPNAQTAVVPQKPASVDEKSLVQDQPVEKQGEKVAPNRLKVDAPRVAPNRLKVDAPRTQENVVSQPNVEDASSDSTDVSTTEGVKAKEPWQMTKDEWDAGAGIEKYIRTVVDRSMPYSPARSRYFRNYTMPDGTTLKIPKSTYDELQDDRYLKAIADSHEKEIRVALQQGKSVPDEVLSAYPALAKNESPKTADITTDKAVWGDDVPYGGPRLTRPDGSWDAEAFDQKNKKIEQQIREFRKRGGKTISQMRDAMAIGLPVTDVRDPRVMGTVISQTNFNDIQVHWTSPLAIATYGEFSWVRRKDQDELLVTGERQSIEESRSKAKKALIASEKTKPAKAPTTVESRREAGSPKVSATQIAATVTNGKLTGEIVQHKGKEKVKVDTPQGVRYLPVTDKWKAVEQADVEATPSNKPADVAPNVAEANVSEKTRKRYPAGVEDQTELTEFKKAEAKAEQEKPSQSTGYTKTQTAYIADKLKDYANEYPQGMLYGADTKEFKQERLGGGVASTRTEQLKPETIAVPADGVVKITDLQQANRLHQRLTGKPLTAQPKEVIPAKSGTSVVGRELRSAMATSPNATNLTRYKLLNKLDAIQYPEEGGFSIPIEEVDSRYVAPIKLESEFNGENGKGWVESDVNGQKAYTNGHLVLVSDKPFGAGTTISPIPSNQIVDDFKKKEVAVTKPERAVSLAIESGVEFSDGKIINFKYYNLIKTQYPNATFKADPKDSGSVLGIYDGKKLVGFVMPLRGARPYNADGLADEPPMRSVAGTDLFGDAPMRSVFDRNDIIDSKGINYDKAKDVARRIESGSLEIRRLNPEIERGRIAGGKRNVEATILLAADARASEKAGSSRGARVDSYTDTARRQERLLAPNGKPSNLNERQWREVRTPAFIKWFGDWINDPENASKAVDENGEPKVLYHGTTHDFEAFDPSRGNIGGHLGRVIYLTDSLTDVGENYAGEGPDLTGRIEQAAERWLNDNDLDYNDKNIAKARQEVAKTLKGSSDGLTMPLYVQMKNPLDLTDDNPTRFDALEQYDEETDEYTENEDSLPMKLYNALQEVENYGTYDNFNAQRIWNDISEQIGGDWDGVKFSDVDKIMRESEGLIYATDENGDLAGNEILSEIYGGGELGFDGIIIDADKQFGSNRKTGKAMAMDDSTKHYHVFESNQLKSALGNKGTFDPNEDSIMRSVADEPFYSRVESVIRDKMPNRATPAQITALLAKSGVKELDPEFQAIKVWLDGQDGTVSKDAVLEFAQANKVVVGEVVKGNNLDRVEAWWNDEGGANEETPWNELTASEQRDARRQYAEDVEQWDGDPDATSFSQFQLPGESENYREEFLTAPVDRAEYSYEVRKMHDERLGDYYTVWNTATDENAGWGFPKRDKESMTVLAEKLNNQAKGYAHARNTWKDGHSAYNDIVNPIARVRYNDRVTTDGDKMLFAEEIQQPSKENLAKMPKVYQKFGEEMAIRKMLYRAVEGGYDYFGFTTGQQQADRYDLSKHVKQIRTKAWSGGNRKVEIVPIKGDDIEIEVTPDGKVVEGYKEFIGKNLDEVVGKDLAPQILEAPTDGYKVFSGLDLKVGGEGLINRYDRKHVDYINKLMKPYGVSVEAKEIETLSQEGIDLDDYQIIEQDGQYFVDHFGEDVSGLFDSKNEAQEYIQKGIGDYQTETIHAVRISPEFRKAVEASMRENGGAFPMFKLRDLDTQDEMADIKFAHTEDILAGLKGGVMHSNGEIELSPAEQEYLRRAIGEDYFNRTGKEADQQSFDGMMLNRPILARLVKIGEDYRQTLLDAGYTENQLVGYDALQKTLKDVLNTKEQYPIVYVFDDALPEERTHREDFELGRTDAKSRDKINEIFPSDIRGAKFNREYGDLKDADQISEIAAKIETGQSSKYGWDKIEDWDKLSKEITSTWAKGIVEKNRAKIDAMGIDAFLERYPVIGQYYAETTNTGTSRTTEGSQRGQRPAETDSEGDGRGAEAQTQANDASEGRSSEKQKVAAFSRILGQDKLYTPQSRAETETIAQQLLSDKGTQDAIFQALNGKPSAEGMRVVYWELERLNGLADHYLASHQNEEYAAVAGELSNLASQIVARQIANGRETEIAKTLAPLSPEVAIVTATKMKRYATGEDTGLTEVQTKQVTEIAKQLKETNQKLAEETAKRKAAERKIKRLENDREPVKRTVQAKMLKEYQASKPDLLAALRDAFPNSPMFNGESAMRMVAGQNNAMRSVAEKSLDPDKSELLTKYAVGMILEGKTYAEVIGTLEAIAETDVRGIHAKAVEIIKPAKAMTDEAKQRVKTRNEHYKEAEAYNHPNAKAERALVAVKKRIEAQINKLNNEIKSGKVETKEGKLKLTSPEIEALEAQRDGLRKRRDEMFAAEMTPEKRAELAEKAVQRSIEALQKQIDEGKRANKKPAIADTAHLKELKAQRDELRKRLNQSTLSGLAQDAQDAGQDKQTVWAVNRLTNGEPRNLNDIVRELRKESGLTIDQATNVLRKANALVKQLKAERQQKADELKGILPEMRAAENAARIAKQNASMKMQHFFNQIAKRPWLMERFNNDFRAKLVSNWGTQIFNAVQGVASTVTESVIDVFESLVKLGLDPNSDTTIDINPKDAWIPIAYLLGSNNQLAAQALSNFTEDYYRIHAGLLGDIELENPKYAPDANKLTYWGHRWFDKQDDVNRWLSKVSLAKVQEMHFRNASIAATFEQIIRRKSGGKASLKSAMADGTLLDYITENDAKIAADRALRITFASMIDDPVGRQLKRAYDQLGKVLPVILNPVTFARFTYTTTKVMVLNPMLIGALDSKALGGQGYNARSLAKGIMAWSGVAIAYGLLSAFGDDDDRWETITINGVTYDVRRWFPMSAFFYMAHIIKSQVEGRPLPSAKDLLEGFASLETDYFAAGPGMKLAGTAYEVTQGRKDVGDLGVATSAVLASILSGWLRFVKPVKDALAQFDDEEAAFREYDDSNWKQATVKELAKTLPFIGRTAPKQLDAITGQPIMAKAPLARMFGVNVVHPSFLNAKQTPATEWAEKVFVYTPTSEWSKEQKQAFYIRKRIKNAIWRKEVTPSEVQGLIQKYVQDGKLTQRSADILKDDIKLSELQVRVKYGYKPGDKPNPLMDRKLQQVMRRATDVEKQDIEKVIGERIQKAK